MSKIQIGNLSLSRTTHPVLSRTHTAEVTLTDGWTQFTAGDLRVVAAAAIALADEIDRDTQEGK